MKRNRPLKKDEQLMKKYIDDYVERLIKQRINEMNGKTIFPAPISKNEVALRYLSRQTGIDEDSFLAALGDQADEYMNTWFKNLKYKVFSRKDGFLVVGKDYKGKTWPAGLFEKEEDAWNRISELKGVRQ